MSVKQTLLDVLRPSAPTGFEGALAELIAKRLAGAADDIRTDALGNLIVTKKAKKEGGKRLMFAAHMDQIGFIVTEADENGFLRLTTLGGINVPLSVARHVVFASGKQGVLHCETEREGKELAGTHLFADVGAATREEALAIAQIGDWAVYAPQVSELGNRIASPYMDDRAGVALLMEAFLQAGACENEVVAVFTVQEEVGLRGATTAAYSVDPDLAIAIDVTPAGDTPKSVRLPVKLGAGPAVKVMDRSIVCHPQVRTLMEETAAKHGIPFQREVLPYGGTDSGAIHLTRGGVRSGVLSIPCRYVHSPVETIDLSDLEGGVSLLAAIMNTAI